MLEQLSLWLEALFIYRSADAAARDMLDKSEVKAMRFQHRADLNKALAKAHRKQADRLRKRLMGGFPADGPHPKDYHNFPTLTEVLHGQAKKD